MLTDIYIFTSIITVLTIRARWCKMVAKRRCSRFKSSFAIMKAKKLGELDSTEVAFLHLTQQPPVLFSAFSENLF